MRSHYDTLGVPKDASARDIKAAFLKLSKETHPDVGGTTADAERFKRISAAASILTNPTKREAYNRSLDMEGPFGRGPHADSEQTMRKPFRRAPATGLSIFLHNIFRPRTFSLGTIGIFATMWATNYMFGSSRPALKDGSDLVQAWKNPDTDQWEQPAPWDPTYQRLKPDLVLIPREEVRRRHR